MKITIRIPVVVSPDGEWYAYGPLERGHDGLTKRFLNGEGKYWIEAEVDTPARAADAKTITCAVAEVPS